MADRVDDAADDWVVVGRIGKAHGVKGEVSVEPRTDEPDRRFVVGAVLRAQAPDGGPARFGDQATVEALRWHQERLLIRFREIPDRTAAEQSRGTRLVVRVDPTEHPEDPEEFYDHQLVGLRAETTAGELVGTVREVLHSGAQDLLVIGRDAGADALVPFVTALVPDVDVEAGRLRIADRPGLLES